MKITFYLILACPRLGLVTSYNVLPLAAVGDFGALHCQQSTDSDRSTKLDLTTEPAIFQNPY